MNTQHIYSYKILVVPSWYPNEHDTTSGIFIKEQTEALNNLGYHMSIFHPNIHFQNSFKTRRFFPAIDHQNINNIPTYSTIGFVLPKRLPFMLKIWAKINLFLFEKYLLQEGKPDIIHAHSFIGGYLAMKISEKYNIPYIITEHHTEFLLDKPKKRYLNIAKPVFKNAKKIIAVSPFLKEKLEQFNRETFYIPNFVDGDIFNTKKSKTAKSSYKLISVGSIDKYKNIDKLIHAFNLLIKKNDNISLTIVGKGNQKEKLVKLANSYKINYKITWIDQLEHNEVADIMRSHNILIQSSDWETFGIVLIESIACGTPVVSTANGGPLHIINKTNGISIPNSSPMDLTEAILKIISNIDQYNASLMSKEIIDIYGKDNITKQIIETYKQIIENKSSSRN